MLHVLIPDNAAPLLLQFLRDNNKHLRALPTRGDGEPISPERHGSQNVFKFPRHKRQYRVSTLPTGPEAA